APAAEPGWSFRMFYLPPSFLASMCPELPHSPLHFKTPFLQNPALAQSLLHLHGAMEEPAHRLELQSALIAVLADLSESYAFEPLLKAPSKSDRSSMRLALDYLHENYYRNPTLEELAALSPFGPSHFLRSFRTTVGLTPHAYLLQLRVERAMALLHTRTPIVEIANALGFVDQSHFTRIFKRILGITPSRFLANTR
ncbi:MAG TPA: AraC family transcriptional regulator, partial [Acidobacteriaceae bacterium]|nr:AraC family transcriptional regulator [Acidobacteriaceae bacterium]